VMSRSRRRNVFWRVVGRNGMACQGALGRGVGIGTSRIEIDRDTESVLAMPQPLVSKAEIQRQPAPDFHVVLDVRKPVPHAQFLEAVARSIARRKNVAECGAVAGGIEAEEEIRKTEKSQTRATPLPIDLVVKPRGAAAKTKIVSATHIRQMILESEGRLLDILEILTDLRGVGSRDRDAGVVVDEKRGRLYTMSEYLNAASVRCIWKGT
jgi:hypothetical protein